MYPQDASSTCELWTVDYIAAHPKDTGKLRLSILTFLLTCAVTRL